jgi:hypothetical protein
VRDAASLLDLELDIRPCPGALSYDGGFSDEVATTATSSGV